MAQLLIMCIGIPGSGKTTWVNEYVKAHSATVVVSTDEIRKELYGTSECDARLNPIVYNEAKARTRKALEEKHDVIVDATNTDIDEWTAYKELCPDNTIRVAKVFDVEPEEAFARMQGRERKVPMEILEKKWHELLTWGQWLPFFFKYII